MRIIKVNKLKIIPVRYGLGKFYTYTDLSGLKHPCIEMNLDMLDFDVGLFIWVFNHELDHYLFYSDPENEGKKNSMLKEITRLIENPVMFSKLNRFEREHKSTAYIKNFTVNRELDTLNILKNKLK